MEKGVTYARLDLDGTDRFVPLRSMLGVTAFGINLILLQRGQRGRIHRHEKQEEVYLVLEGTLSLLVDGQARDLGRGEIVRVAPQVRRQLVNRGPGRCAILALGGADGYVGRDATAFVSWTDEDGAPPQQIPLPGDLGEDERRR